MSIRAAIVQDDLIGLEVRVAQSSNPSCIGITGRIIDETRNTVVIRHEDEEKIIAKGATSFQFTLPDGSLVEIEGDVIFGRAEDRVKKRPRRRW